MEENKLTKSHKITLTNRKSGSFTGVLDVISFDIGEVLLETELGMLHIKGKDLHVNRLNLEKGEVVIEGLIEAFHYSPVPIGIKGKDSLLGKLFH
jgi:sporulation protein YabP